MACVYLQWRSGVCVACSAIRQSLSTLLQNRGLEQSCSLGLVAHPFGRSGCRNTSRKKLG